MTAEQINAKALEFISNQDFENDQKLLFENAKANPSYQTYGNLGHFIVSVGFARNDKRADKGFKLGYKYLLTSLKMKPTLTNSYALVQAIERHVQSKSLQRNFYYKKAKTLLISVDGMVQDTEHKYNILRYEYLLNPKDTSLLKQAESIFEENPSAEAAELYLGLLGINQSKKGIDFISEHRAFLDAVDLLMYYSKIGEYEKGYELCEDVLRIYSIDKFIASAIIECCVNTAHFDEAKVYAQEISENQSGRTRRSRHVFKHIFKSLLKSSKYRKRMLLKYHPLPPLISRCGYFGCPNHKTNWL